MRPFSIFSVFVAAAASVLGQTIQIGAPASGQVLSPGVNFTTQIILPGSPEYCAQVGIALAINTCNNGVCPNPAEQLGYVLYSGPWTPTVHNPGGYYQNFTVLFPSVYKPGPGIFTVTHLCLLEAGPYPLLEFRNVTLTIG